MARKKKGRDVIKKSLPLLIKYPPGSREYHANYQRLNRNFEREMKHNDNPSMRKLERQAENLFRDMEKVLTKKIIKI